MVKGGGGQGFCGGSTDALVIISVTMGGGGRRVQNCVTSFTDDLMLVEVNIKANIVEIVSTLKRHVDSVVADIKLMLLLLTILLL